MILRASPSSSDPLAAVLLARPDARAGLGRGLAAAGLDVVAVHAEADAAVADLAARRPDVWVAEADLLTRAACERLREGPFADPLLRPTLLVVGGAGMAAGEAAALALHAGAAAFLPADAFGDAPGAAGLRRAEVARVREAVHVRRLGWLGGLVAAGGVAGRGADSREPGRYAERLAVPEGNELRFVPVEAVDVVRAEHSHAVLHVGDERLAVRETLAELEARLDPAAFCRVHRSTIVRLAAVAALRTAPGGDYTVRLVDGSEWSVGRSRRDDLVARLGAAGR